MFTYFWNCDGDLFDQFRPPYGRVRRSATNTAVRELSDLESARA